MTHTPGPWKTIPNQGWFGNDSKPPVGNLDSFNNPADRALTLAAPELLAALKGLHAFACHYQGKMSDRQRDLLEASRAAIAKAEGKE